MKPPQLLRVVALVLFATGAAPAAAATREAVYQLTGANFDVLTSSGAWFIEFYAPWCGHCRQLAPVFEEAAQEAGTKMHFGKVDCDDEKELQRRFDVKSFPTLVLLRDGEHRVYKGERTKEALLAFVDAVSAPAVVDVDAASFKAAAAKQPVTFVHCGPRSGASFSAFHKVARRHQALLSFLHTSDEALLRKLGVDVSKCARSGAAIRVTKGLDPAVLEGPLELERVNEFVLENRLPLVTTISAGTFEDVVNSGRLAAIGIVDEMKESTKRFTESLWETARRLKSRFAFAEIDGVLYESYITQLGVKRENFPVLFVLDYHNEKFYPPPPNINTLSVAGMERFLRMVDAGDIQAVSIGIWWSPLRLIRWFEKWLARFSDTELMVGSGVVFFVITGIMFWLFCMGDNAPPEPKQPQEKQQERKGGDADAGADAVADKAKDGGGAAASEVRKRK